MSDRSAIEWTEATWNPIVGCSIVSPGCIHCYAMRQAARIQKMNPTGGSGTNYVNHYDGTTEVVNGNAVWTGKVAKAPNKIFLQPLSWAAPRAIFVNSMGDLFHEAIPDEDILDVMTIIAIAGRHTFQVLTKRSDRMCEFMNRRGLLEDIYANWCGFSGAPREVESWPLHNLWLGISAENQTRLNERGYHLRDTPAAVRFISYEPALGPLELGDPKWLGSWLHWLIAGGESGPNARPAHPDWFRSVRDQCAAAGVPFFFKQWGEWAHGSDFRHDAITLANDGTWWTTSACAPSHIANRWSDLAPTMMHKAGKKRAGRLLDGIEHKGMPKSAA